MTGTPSLAELEEIAARALAHAEGDAQATAIWHRDDDTTRLGVEVTCVIDGRAAAARAAGSSADDLRRAGRAAALHSRRARAWPSAGLPEPVADRPGGASAGGDEPPAAAELPGAGERPGVRVRTGETRMAIASARGVRAAEQRTYAIGEVLDATPGRTVRLRAAARTAGGLPLEALARDARALGLDRRDAADLDPGELPVVLGHDAVAALLEHLRPAFGVELDLGSGPLHGRLGTAVAAAAIDLETPATGFDAEGLPRRAVRLIAEGIAASRVHDTASGTRADAQSTGHATRAAALAPLPEHLVLGGGDADGIGELCTPMANGLYVPALSAAREADGDTFRHTAHGAMLIEDGEPATPVRDCAVLVDPLAVLASVEALSRMTRSIPLVGHAPGGPGIALVPAVRAAAGCRAL